MTFIHSQVDLDLDHFQIYLEPLKTMNDKTKGNHVKNVRKFLGCLEFEGRTLDCVAILCNAFRASMLRRRAYRTRSCDFAKTIDCDLEQ